MLHLSGYWLHVDIWRKRVRTRRAGLREEIHYGFFLLGVALFWLVYVALFCWVWGCCVAGFSVVEAPFPDEWEVYSTVWDLALLCWVYIVVACWVYITLFCWVWL